MNVERKSIRTVHMLVMFTTVFAMMTVCFFVLMFSARSIVMSKQLLQQKVKVRAAEGLEVAGQTMLGILNETAIAGAGETYGRMIAEVIPSSDHVMSEYETECLYREYYYQYLSKAMNEASLSDRFQERFSIDRGNVTMDGSELKLTAEEVNGRIESLQISGIQFAYQYGETYYADRDFAYEIELPTATFYNGNDLLFDYSLIGEKGIYFTGKTSSVVGDLYAGTHDSEEFRKAEGSYGEREIYGGINVLSTQLGIEAGNVVSAGNINLKGSFVVFGTEEKPVEVYANEIKELSGYFMSTDYLINGRLNSGTGTEYENILHTMQSAGSEIDNFAYYYDSNNDENYHGQYRIILSNTDVTLSGDFTGAVVTCGNVIIEADSNVEGLVFSKDRIYVQGNNNIVSNRDILRAIIDDECKKDPDYGSFYLKDYLGGIHYQTGAEHSANMVKMR